MCEANVAGALNAMNLLNFNDDYNYLHYNASAMAYKQQELPQQEREK